ncbi:MAG: autoinducer-2 kinase [Gaiellaceae bacterium]
MTELLLAIDAGTGSCRAVLFDPEGNQVAMRQREWAHREQPGVAGSQVFDTDRNWQLVCACVREALAAPGVTADAVRAVSTTSMREGMVLYDARGREIWACPNVDSRAGEEAGELVRSGLAQEIYALAGDWVAITAPARFLWIAKHEPDAFAAIAHVGMLGDWILTRLCGEYATDPSLGSSSGMFDLAARSWSERVIEVVGLEPDVFPRVQEPGTVVGAVTAAAAEATGLRPGTPCAVGGADTQLALLGIGVVDTGRSTIVGGSFWQHTAVLAEPRIDPEARLRTLCHAVPGTWMIEGIGFYSGLTMRWFRDAFCAADVAEAAAQGRDVYTLLEAEASAVPPGSNGVLGIFSNLMEAKRWIHASPAFLQFDISSPEHSGKKECFRAIEEAAAYVSRGHLAIVEEVAGVGVDDVVFTGGAANGPLWSQILADVLGVPVRVPAVRESTALGAAVCAGVGAGLYDSLTDVSRLVRFERTHEPEPTAAEAYDELYTQWLRVYDRMLQLSEDGVVRPLWRAAGT